MMREAIEQRGRSAESVAEETVRRARDYLAHAAPVGPHLADQLLLPMAFGGVSTFATCEPTLHFTSNCDVIAAHRSDSSLFNVIRYTIWS